MLIGIEVTEDLCFWKDTFASIFIWKSIKQILVRNCRKDKSFKGMTGEIESCPTETNFNGSLSLELFNIHDK
jgi:hypothetical protein